jgi:hypothetical protein
MIKSWSKFIQWSSYDQNSYNDQVMIKIHGMIKLWSKFIQSSKHDQNSYKCQIRSITYYFQRSKIIFKKLIRTEFYDEVFLQIVSTETILFWKWKMWPGRPYWLGGHIGWEARLDYVYLILHLVNNSTLSNNRLS